MPFLEWDFLPSLRDLNRFDDADPPLKRRAIFKNVPPGHLVLIIQKIWLVTGGGCMKIQTARLK